MEKWVKQQVGPSAFVRQVKESLPQLSEELPQLPHLAYRLLKDATDGKLEIRWKSDELAQIKKELQQGQQRARQSIGGGSLLISGVLLGSLGSNLLSVSMLPLLSGGLSLLGISLLGLAFFRR